MASFSLNFDHNIRHVVVVFKRPPAAAMLDIHFVYEATRVKTRVKNMRILSIRGKKPELQIPKTNKVAI